METDLYKHVKKFGCSCTLANEEYHRIYEFSKEPYRHPGWPQCYYNCGQIETDRAIRLCMDCSRRAGLLW